MTVRNQTTAIVARAGEGRNMYFQENPSNESRDTTEKALISPRKVLLIIHLSQRNVHT